MLKLIQYAMPPPHLLSRGTISNDNVAKYASYYILL